MKLSKRGEYGLRAMIDLAIAQEFGRDLIQLKELSENEKIPRKFLEQILTLLRQGKFVETARGKYGGHRLARSADQIFIGQLVRHLDGPLAPINCVSQTAYERCTCPDEAHCGLRMLMLDVRNAIANILDRYTLANVVEVTLRKMRSSNFHVPFSLAASASGINSTPQSKVKTRAPGEVGLEEFFYRDGI
jgi:Rrf2 family protein